MNPKLKTITLFLINSALVLVLILLKPTKDSSLIFTHEYPIEVNSDQKPILIRGAVVKQGTFSVNRDTTLANLISNAGGYTEKADVTFTNNYYNNKNLYELPFIYIPYLETRKLLINFSSDQEITKFFNTSNQNAQKIISKRPFLTIEDFNLTLNTLGLKESTEVEL